MKVLSLNTSNLIKIGALLGLMGLVVNNGFAADMPQMPKPTPEHQWLQQLVGEWDSETEAIAEPGQPAIHSKGTESIQAVGGFWTTSEINSTVMDQPFKGLMTLGYDPEKKKYIGTWVDSMTGKLWQYEGLITPGSNILTLESEGTCPMSPDKPMKFRDVLELKDKDHKVFSSSVLGENGKWTPIMTSKAQRKH